MKKICESCLHAERGTKPDGPYLSCPIPDDANLNDCSHYKPQQEKKVVKKYEPTDKCTLKNIADACTGCNEAKLEFFDFYQASICNVTIPADCQLQTNWVLWHDLISTSKRINWLLKHGFIKEVTELKPCPFCGAESIKVENDKEAGDWYVFCNECLSEGPNVATEVIAIRSWNTRK
jgi:Lar family restriction alleviation protein